MFRSYICFLSLFLFFSCQEKQETMTLYAIPKMVSELGAPPAYSGLDKLVFDTKDGTSNKVYKAIEGYVFHDFKIEKNDNPNIATKRLEGNERAYLEIKAEGIIIGFKTDDDLYAGAGKLCQLSALGKGRLPMGKFLLSARFGYRGMHLDVSRHFFAMDEIKRYIDYLFFYGFNKFHWHLTDDQGWRIEIKSYPRLQEISAYREETLIGHYNDQPHQFDGKKYGGYYTQEEVKEIVQYAHNKGIEVIPEIEMPGHSRAAIAAYPELTCHSSDNEYTVATKWGVFSEIYCPTQKTFAFLEDVLDEVITLFPSKYIHIGGDEAPKTIWQKSAFCQQLMKREKLKDEMSLQSYFIKRIEAYLNGKGKIIIGWDEILEGGLAPNAIVMSWRGMEGGIEAAKEGHKVIMTPTSHCYFDYYQSERDSEPLAIGGYLPLRKVYDFEPIPEDLPEDKKTMIWGAQGNVWTEYMQRFSKVEYMALARMAALSEVLYLDKEQRDYSDFVQRLSVHIEYWKSKDVNIAEHLAELQPTIIVEANEGTTIEDFNLEIDAEIEVQTPGDSTWQTVDDSSYVLKNKGLYHFRSTPAADIKGDQLQVDYKPHLGTKAEINLVEPPHPAYFGHGPSALINGIAGSTQKYSDMEWLGFWGKDLEATIDLKEENICHDVSLSFFVAEGQWIYAPKTLSIFGSKDGQAFTQMGKTETFTKNGNLVLASIPCSGESYKFLKVVATNAGIIPVGKQGEGNPAWLFVDEIRVSEGY